MKVPRLSFAVRSLLLAACLGWFGLPSAFAQKLYSVDRSSPRLRELNPANGATVSSVIMNLAGRTISGATGLAADPTTGKFYALLRLVPFAAEHPSARQLVTVDVTTGVVTDIGSTVGTGNLSFADLAFDANGNLYGVTGDGSPTQPRTLFTLNKSNGAATSFMPLGNGDDGESIAYNSDNGLLYHASGKNEAGTVVGPNSLAPNNMFFEPVNLSAKTVQPRITLSGPRIQEAGALAYAGGGAFLWSSLDFNEDLVFRLMRVTSTGTITLLGVTDHLATGLAFVPTVTAPSPAPTLASISPTSVVVNSGVFTLTATGSGFVNGTTVQWNGANRTTTFVNSTNVITDIPASDITAVGTAQVTVVNPAPGSGTSAAKSLSITAATANPVPTITATTPASVAANSGAFTLTVTGTGFVTGTTVQWNGSSRLTTFVSGTQLTSAISAADVAAAGTAQVTVVNPAPGGGTSAARSFSITSPTANPVPTISSITPTTVAAVSGAFTLSVTGTGFFSGSTVQWNGASRTTTFVSSTQVTASISAGDVATAGTAQVTVINPAPGGGTSAARSFLITAPSTSGPPTVAFIQPVNNTTYSSRPRISVNLSVGGDQTGVVDFLVKFTNAPSAPPLPTDTLLLRPPTLAGDIPSQPREGWYSLKVEGRNAAGTVVASSTVNYFLASPPPSEPLDPITSCIADLLRPILIFLGLITVESSPGLPPRQALPSTAADVGNLDLDVLRAFRDEVLMTTPAGRYYSAAYERTSFSLIEIAVREPALALAIYQTLQDWTPAIRALVNRQGGTVTITPTMAAQVQTLLTNLRRSATGELASIMDTEIAALNPSTWSGLTIGQLLARFESQSRTPLPLIAPGRISNMAIRSSAGTGAQTLIVGAVIGGAGTSGNKPLLIRGVGPALTAFGVPGALADPILNVFAGTNVIASNDNWGGNAQVTTVGNALGAFGLAPATSRDAALYAPALAPRDYTIQITGTGGATGVALAEIYDATPTDSFTATRPQLVNVSARTQVGTGADILIAGFTLTERPRRLLIRAVGPTLGAFGVTGALADPQLALFSGTNQLQQNNDWGTATNAADITAATTQLGTFQLGAGAKDSAILTTLQPGSYTAQISGVGNTTGVALVEIYVLP